MAPRLTGVVLLLALSTACASTHVVRLDTGEGAPLEYRPPPSNKSVRVDAEAFEDALARWVLNTPLPLRSSQQGWLVRASYPSDDTETRSSRLMRNATPAEFEAFLRLIYNRPAMRARFPNGF